ncbi:unnamed protein product [Leptosia nina]|uniref:Uncharacterized protein n=1 Tax=Leptosia nina TaxID=320188 RepID=A0AAV1J4N5_9NEOP
MEYNLAWITISVDGAISVHILKLDYATEDLSMSLVAGYRPRVRMKEAGRGSAVAQNLYYVLSAYPLIGIHMLLYIWVGLLHDGVLSVQRLNVYNPI